MRGIKKRTHRLHAQFQGYQSLPDEDERGWETTTGERVNQTGAKLAKKGAKLGAKKLMGPLVEVPVLVATQNKIDALILQRYFGGHRHWVIVLGSIPSEA